MELETGEAAQNFQWRQLPITSVQPLCAEVLEANRELAEEKGVHLVYEVPEQMPAFYGDYDYLRMALVHLVENAIKFSDKPESRVELRVSADDDHIFFAVQDWGRGIEPQYLDEIWKPFTQIKREQYEDQGAGSGLSIVRGIAALHGGEVRLESTYGAGSTFTLVLPRNRPAAYA